MATIASASGSDVTGCGLPVGGDVTPSRESESQPEGRHGGRMDRMAAHSSYDRVVVVLVVGRILLLGRGYLECW